jgi:hypothetical protein
MVETFRHRGSSDIGTPGGTRTHNLQGRNLLLYPVELRGHCNHSKGRGTHGS